ncbi:MAG: hypothetical protein R2762_30585 [Bryobacteraceae bacterium]
MTPVLWLTLPAAVVDWSPGPVSPPHTAPERAGQWFSRYGGVHLDCGGFQYFLIRNPGYNTARRTDAFVARVSPAGE